MNYGKNLQVPNIANNDVYYKRQLSVYVFNIHVVASSKSIFFLYAETEWKQGSDDVCSVLHDFVYNHLDEKVKHLHIFCDSCNGQNKNLSFIRFLLNFVYEEKRLISVEITSPVRGNYYIECNKNMGHINSKIEAELLSGLFYIIENSRKNPSPF